MLMLLSVIILFASGVFSLTRQAQMLQQNSYFPSRYIKWLKGEFSKNTVFSGLGFVIATLLLLLNLDILSLIFAFIVVLIKIPRAKRLQKKSIKAIHFTARVKRQYATFILCLIVILALYRFVNELFAILGYILVFMPAVSILLVRYLNAPMENLFIKYFTNDAKKLLKASAGLKVIGITGSYGKTSTKHILSTLLNEKFNCLHTPNSFNTPLGIVRTVRESLSADTEIFIAEMGAKNVGDIKEICDIANPQIALITSVGPQHLDTFKSIENVAKTKFELADSVKSVGGKIYLNTDNEYIKEKSKEYDNISYGTAGEIKYSGVSYTEKGAEFDVEYKGNKLHLATRLLGAHNVSNIVVCVGVALDLGVSPRDIAYAARKLQPIPHRLEMKNYVGGSILLDDAYNANPVGSIEAVNVLGSFEGKRKIIVTPGLVELGEKEYECNFNLGVAAAKKCDTIILVGEKRAIPIKDGIDSVKTDAEVIIVPAFKDAAEILKTVADKNTVVLFENDLPDNYAK